MSILADCLTAKLIKIAALKNQDNEILFIMRKIMILPNLIHGSGFTIDIFNMDGSCNIDKVSNYQYFGKRLVYLIKYRKYL
jgi:ribosomal protein S19